MHFVSGVAVLLLSTAASAAQEPTPTFEVASIKPAAADARGSFIQNIPGGQMRISNMTLKDLVVIAYRLQPFQVSGGPAWLASERYDVLAKPEKDPGADGRLVMLQNLLKDRFALQFHRETKETSVYELVTLKNPGKLGPGLTESKEDGCIKPEPGAPPRFEAGGKMPCGMLRIGINQILANGRPVSQLAQALSRMLGQTVVDKTGLTANYDIKLEWAPDQSHPLQMSPDAPKPPPGDSPGPSIFTAVQEQLGLKLESRKGTVETLTIDHAEKPSPN